MKTKRLLLALGIVILACFQVLNAQTKEERKELKAKEVKEQLDSKDYSMRIDRVVPMGGRTRVISPEYSLAIRNDSVFSYLPYFGRAYNIPYGGGSGMIFNQPIKDYKLSYNKKGTAQITFQARNEGDTHQFRLQVYPNASVTISIVSMNRQGISYYGTLNLKSDKEE